LYINFPNLTISSLFLIGNTRLYNLSEAHINALQVFSFDNNIYCNLINSNLRSQITDCCGNGEFSSTNNEFCDDSTSCNQDCTDCSNTHYTPHCIPCQCKFGLCSFGKGGNGLCLDCFNNYYGVACNQSCQCYKGLCKDGVFGDGKCFICFTNYYGEYCDKFCYCDKGDCDTFTGVCHTCFDDYFGTNCLVPKVPDQTVFPIVNCVEQLSLSTYIYLGYANTNPLSLKFLNNSVGNNIFICGRNNLSIPIQYFLPGQYNFVAKVQCNENITWSLNGSVLELSRADLLSKPCSSISAQKFVIQVPEISTFSESEKDTLKSKIAEISNINLDRVNVTDRPNEEYKNKDGELIISIDKTSSSEAEHSDVLYSFTQLFSNSSTLKNFLNDANILAKDARLKTLTFNETVGTIKGCFKEDNSGLVILALGSNDDCYKNPQITSTSITDTNTGNTDTGATTSPNKIDNTPETSLVPVYIAVVVGIFGSIILMTIILMIIPGTRNAIFKKQNI